jgi:hypothetical protein
MRRCDQASGGPHRFEEPVARIAGSLFDRAAVAPRLRGDIGLGAHEAQPQDAAGFPHEGGIGCAVGSKPVVEVRHGQPPMPRPGSDQGRRSMQERHRVGAARDGEHQGGIVGDAQRMAAAIDRIGQEGCGVGGGGSGGRIRTTDQGLMSPLLYH